MRKLNLWIALVASFLGTISFLLTLASWQSPSSPYFKWAAAMSIGCLVIGVVNVYFNYARSREVKKHTRLAEELFLHHFGKKADKTEIILRHTYRVGPLKRLLSDKTEWAKFWSQNKVYKGTVDVENQVLYIEEPEFVPVYADESVPLWKEVTRVYSNGMPKKVEFYDDTEFPHREEYLDKSGALKSGSWRRLKGSMEYWNPKKQIWEPVP